MAKKSKQYQEAAKLVDRDKAYDVTEAVDLVKKWISQNLMQLLKLPSN